MRTVGRLGKAFSEEKVLKKLGIPDFQHMTNDNVASFASMLPKMDPAVAKKAFEQSPEFTVFSKEIVSLIKYTIGKGFASNNDSVQSFNSTCDNIILTLDNQLKDENLSFEEKNILIDKMIFLARMKGEKDSENKIFIWNKVKIILGGVGAGIIAAIFVGPKVDVPLSHTSYNPDDFDADYNPHDDAIDADYENCESSSNVKLYT